MHCCVTYCLVVLLSCGYFPCEGHACPFWCSKGLAERKRERERERERGRETDRERERGGEKKREGTSSLCVLARENSGGGALESYAWFTLWACVWRRGENELIGLPLTFDCCCIPPTAHPAQQSAAKEMGRHPNPTAAVFYSPLRTHNAFWELTLQWPWKKDPRTIQW